MGFWRPDRSGGVSSAITRITGRRISDESGSAAGVLSDAVRCFLLSAGFVCDVLFLYPPRSE